MIRLLLFSLCLTLLSVPAHAQQDLPSKANEAASVNTAPDTAWVTSASDDGYYTISFPAPPVDTVFVNNSAAGPIRTYRKLHESDTGVLISGYFVLPKTPDSARVDSVLRGSAEGIANRPGFSDASIQPIQLDGYPGRHIRSTSENGILEWRIYLVGAHLYQTGYVSETEQTARKTRFFDSFRLTLPPDSIAALAPARPTLEMRLDALGWNYEVQDNRYKMVVRTDSVRTQLLYAIERSNPIAETTRFEIWAPVTFGETPLSGEVLQDLMVKNGELELGAFRTYTIDNGYYTAFVARIDARTEADTLEDIFFYVSETADDAEKKWTDGKDEY